MSDDNLEVDDLVKALKQNKDNAKKVIMMPTSLKKEEAEKFVIDTSANLINKAMSVMDELQARVTQSAGMEEILAYAELMKAATAAAETLSKIVKTDKDNATKLEIKNMDVKAKLIEAEGGGNTTYRMKREDLMAMIEEAQEKNKSSGTKKLASSETIDVQP